MVDRQHLSTVNLFVTEVNYQKQNCIIRLKKHAKGKENNWKCFNKDVQG